MMLVGTVGTAVLLLGLGGDTTPTKASPVPLYDNLGTYHRSVATGSPQAQRYFDQGLRLLYGFNHAEAILAFREAANLDSLCAMCQWGIALAMGPNINLPMDSAAVGPAYATVQKAIALSSPGVPVERALILALSKRYSKSPPADRAPLDSAYANAMAAVVKRFPDDLDAATLYAESLLDLRPWDQWKPDGWPQPGTLEIVGLLEGVIQRNPNHPGACHYYIHSVEASPNPERALPCAERLPGLMPGAGHLVHMPAHIFIRLGRYADAVAANEHAAHVDEQYIADRAPEGPYPLMYYSHNLHFLLVAHLMLGNSAGALAAAERLAASVPADAVREMPFIEYFVPLTATTLMKFGRWKDLLALPAPPADFKYATAIWRYTQGMAQAAVGDPKGAQAALQVVKATDLGGSGAGGPFGPLLLRLAAAELQGEIAARQGYWDQAIASLHDAVSAEDSLGYTEPPWPYHPVRQTLGAVLLAAKRPAEAEGVYRQDLAINPHNGWSLFGLSQSLQDQGKKEAADSAAAEFRQAWSQADVELRASRY